MKNYKIKLTVISPIHIGAGEDYEPINYVIDKEGEKYYMYIFDEFKFYNSLDEKSKLEFNNIVNDSKDGLRRLQKFINLQKELCKKIANRKVRALNSVVDEYNKKIGKVVQKEHGRDIISQLIIEKTYISPNSQKAIIPGSSIKGAIRTAFGEYELKKDKNLQNADGNRYKLQKIEEKLNKYFGKILISDSDSEKTSTFVARAVNYKRNKETKDSEDGIKINYEAIRPGNKFEINLTIKDDIVKLENLLLVCNEHYLPIFKSQFDENSDGFASKKLSKTFIEKYKSLKLEENQFLLRVGKHSGARAVTIDGIREISIMKGKRRFEKEDEETTVWHIGSKPFGWLLCEIVE